MFEKQTYKSFEWIIIDDGSEDNTKDVVDGFLKENNFLTLFMFIKKSRQAYSNKQCCKNVQRKLFHYA